MKSILCSCGICGICTGNEEIHESDKIQERVQIETSISVLWITANMKDVLDYFAKDYRLLDGTKLVSYEAFVDVQKGKIAFKLVTENAEK